MSYSHHPQTGFAIGDPYTNPLAKPPTPEAAGRFFDSLILSASGWRGVFGAGDEDTGEAIAPSARYVASRMADVFSRHLLAQAGQRTPAIAIGIDTRPSGPAIADCMIRVFLANGLNVRYTFICSAPEIMAWVKLSNRLAATAGPAAGAPLPGAPDDVEADPAMTGLDGFCYVSASHNPVGHNGVKFGLADGAVLEPATAKALAEELRSGACQAADIARLQALCAAVPAAAVSRAYADCPRHKRLVSSSYILFSREICAALDDSLPAGFAARQAAEEARLDSLSAAVAAKGIGLLIDMNGSARSLSIDAGFLTGLGADVQTINDQPRKFAHRIVPEGASLDQCRSALAAAHAADERYVLGYVPDCDGDRGNIVIWDEAAGQARSLEAQETFALAVLAELAGLEYDRRRDGVKPGTALAVVGNDATSLRADAIARAFGAQMHRAETGEANVVALARQLRAAGRTVRILGEGSNGGVITHPASVRDPLNTVCALLKLLAIRDAAGQDCPYRLWLAASGQLERYRPDFSLADIVASLPEASSTSVFEERAALRIQSVDQAAIKNHSRRLFATQWPRIAARLAERFGPLTYVTLVSRGTSELSLAESEDAASGGLKFRLHDQAGRPVAFFWMRGSGTEPVFRIMVDVRAADRSIEPDLLTILTGLVREADDLAMAGSAV